MNAEELIRTCSDVAGIRIIYMHNFPRYTPRRTDWLVFALIILREKESFRSLMQPLFQKLSGPPREVLTSELWAEVAIAWVARRVTPVLTAIKYTQQDATSVAISETNTVWQTPARLCVQCVARTVAIGPTPSLIFTGHTILRLNSSVRKQGPYSTLSRTTPKWVMPICSRSHQEIWNF